MTSPWHFHGSGGQCTRRLRRTAWWLAGLLLTLVAAAADDSRPLNIPAGPAARALQELARQSEQQIVFAMTLVRGIRTRGLRGTFTAETALARLLANTGLEARQDQPGGAYVVDRAPAPAISGGAAPSRAESGTVYLNPFDVPAHRDHGYGALQSNSLTAFRASVQALPVSVELFTRDFMDDLAATSVENIIFNYGSTAGYNGSAANSAPGDRDGSGGLRLRGMSLAALKRDGFVGLRPNRRTITGSTDNYAVERIEVLSGPQSLLYGGSGGGGVVNLISKQAQFAQRRGLIRVSADSYGSARTMFDYNEGGEVLAVRVVGVADAVRSRRDLLGGEFTGLYAQLAYQPRPDTTIRWWVDRNVNNVNHGLKPNFNAFFAAGDPRLGADARYLALTGQLDDVPFGDATPTERNVESLAGWWASERIGNAFTGLAVETQFTPWLNGRLAAVYGETQDRRALPMRSLVPGTAADNPLGETALRVQPGDNQQPHRVRGLRAMLLMEGSFGGGLVHSQTTLGVEAVHETDVDSIDYAYYLADAAGNVIEDPAIATEYGRTRLGPQYFSVAHGPVARPLFAPGTERVVINGQTWVRQTRLRTDLAAVTLDNPLGLLPNNPGVDRGFAGAYSHADTNSRGLFVANLSDWGDGRVHTLVGARFGQSSHLNAGSGGTSFTPRWDEVMTGNLGVSVRLTPSWQAYATLSSSYIPQATQTRNLRGDTLRSITASSPVPEVGFKFAGAEEKLTASLDYNFSTTQKNEATPVDVSFLDAVNPAGLNGRHGGPDRWVNVDRRSRGAELKLTAQPSRQWRLRLSIGTTDGETTGDVRFAQLYNDQFHTDSHGGVTFADGTPVRVDPTGGGGTALTPLTVAMLNDPTNPFYAQPDPDSGSITGAAALGALAQIDPVHGAVATGATGLPLSAMQYAWADPYRHQGEIQVFGAGEKTTGYNEADVNLQSHYAFTAGRLRGLGLFVDLRTTFGNRAYYVQQTAPGALPVNGTRSLFRLPRTTYVGLGLSYRHTWDDGRTFTSQLNIANLFNHYRVWLMPNPANGVLNVARLSMEPRSAVWTNTLEF